MLAGLEEIRRVRWAKRAGRLDMVVGVQSVTRDWGEISRTARLRFLLKFLERISEPRDRWKCYWRKIRKKDEERGRGAKAQRHKGRKAQR